jgi:hypothetical protein
VILYPPGDGLVLVMYSTEAFALYIREVGMFVATATLWFRQSLAFKPLLSSESSESMNTDGSAEMEE